MSADGADAPATRPVRVGLLECDHVPPHMRHIGGDYADMFRSLFARHAPEVDLIGYDVIGGVLPDGPREQDAWIITGSRHSVYEDLPWITQLLDFIRTVDQAGTSMVGVCFGHQAIAHALGGETVHSDRGWGVGIHRADVVADRPWMQPPSAQLHLLMTHQDQVTRLPEGAAVLGCSPHCEVSMFEIGDRMLGIQGHPEFTPAYAAALLDERVERIPPDVMAAARATLAAATDEGVLTRWMAAFLSGSAVSPTG